MRLLVFADIHGNLPAFDALLAHARTLSPDLYLCLGDVAGMGPWPRECLDLLRTLKAHTVLGNADEDLYAPGPFTPKGFPDEQQIFDLDEWSRQQLTDSDLEYARSFAPRLELDLDGHSLLAFHGSPASCREAIGSETPEARLQALRAEYGEQAVWIGGHTHFSLLRSLPGYRLLNPGSVGMSYQWHGGDYRNVARADYLLLETINGQVQTQFRSVSYDVQAVKQGITQRGMPHAGWWVGEWISG